MEKEKNYVRITYNIKKNLFNKINEYSCSTGISRSQILNHLIATSLEDPSIIQFYERSKK